MCGRFTITTPLSELLSYFRVEAAPHQLEVGPRYNIAPSQDVWAIREANSHRKAVLLRWGLIPSWAKDKRIGYKLINARAEGVADKPSFRAAFRQRRCLLPADGFYEWRKDANGRKQPYYFRRRDGLPFAFAGLWEHWNGGGESIDSCTLITTRANEFMCPIHDRMPVILDPSDYELWLAEGQNPLLLEQLLAPAPENLLEAYPVSTAVNKPGNEGPELIRPVRGPNEGSG